MRIRNMLAANHVDFGREGWREASRDVKLCYLSARNVVLLIFFSTTKCIYVYKNFLVLPLSQIHVFLSSYTLLM